MTPDEVREMVWKKAKPSWREWCRVHRVSISHLSEFMNEKRGPTTDILSALQLEWRIVRKRSSDRRLKPEGPRRAARLGAKHESDGAAISGNRQPSLHSSPDRLEGE